MGAGHVLTTPGRPLASPPPRLQVLDMEREVLRVLEFDLTQPTIKTFLRRYIKAASGGCRREARGGERRPSCRPRMLRLAPPTTSTCDGRAPLAASADRACTARACATAAPACLPAPHTQLPPLWAKRSSAPPRRAQARLRWTPPMSSCAPTWRS